MTRSGSLGIKLLVGLTALTGTAVARVPTGCEGSLPLANGETQEVTFAYDDPWVQYSTMAVGSMCATVSAEYIDSTPRASPIPAPSGTPPADATNIKVYTCLVSGKVCPRAVCTSDRDGSGQFGPGSPFTGRIAAPENVGDGAEATVGVFVSLDAHSSVDTRLRIDTYPCANPTPPPGPPASCDVPGVAKGTLHEADGSPGDGGGTASIPTTRDGEPPQWQLFTLNSTYLSTYLSAAGEDGVDGTLSLCLSDTSCPLDSSTATSCADGASALTVDLAKATTAPTVPRSLHMGTGYLAARVSVPAAATQPAASAELFVTMSPTAGSSGAMPAPASCDNTVVQPSPTPAPTQIEIEDTAWVSVQLQLPYASNVVSVYGKWVSALPKPAPAATGTGAGSNMGTQLFVCGSLGCPDTDAKCLGEGVSKYDIDGEGKTVHAMVGVFDGPGNLNVGFFASSEVWSLVSYEVTYEITEGPTPPVPSDSASGSASASDSGSSSSSSGSDSSSSSSSDSSGSDSDHHHHKDSDGEREPRNRTRIAVFVTLAVFSVLGGAALLFLGLRSKPSRPRASLIESSYAPMLDVED